MPITTLPTVPSRGDPPATFIARADAFIAALPTFVAELNAFASSLNNVATTSTSTTSLAIGTGNKALTVDTGKSYQIGMTVKIASTAGPANWMLGDVVSYTSGTGALVVTVSSTQGAGTVADWTVSLSATGGATLGSNTFTGPQNEAQGADIASASTLNLDTATGNLVDVTGVATINAITLAQGAEREIRFTGACTLTHGASLVLPGGTNIVTAAGDFYTFRGYAGGVVRCTGISPANGSEFVTGTRTVFVQAAAPRGWTIDAACNDQVLMAMQGAGNSTGGDWSLTGVFATVPAHTHTATDSGHTHTYTGDTSLAYGAAGGGTNGWTTPGMTSGVGTANITVASTGGTGQVNNSTNWRPTYRGVIVCSKN